MLSTGADQARLRVAAELFSLHPAPPVRCIRKLALVGAPTFFNPIGSSAQLIFALIVTFVISCIYAYVQPYVDSSTNTLALLCQAQIFFVLLTIIAIRTRDGDSAAIDILLVILTWAPLALTVVMSAIEKQVGEKVAKILEKVKKVKTKVHSAAPNSRAPGLVQA